ncbi:hypothetical protein D3C86_1077620 [compost metagenome]
MRADAAAAADPGAAVELDARLDHRVLAEGDPRPDPGGAGALDGHPGFEPLARGALLVGFAEGHQLQPGVDARDLDLVVGRVGGDDQALAVEGRHRVGQVVLALGVVVADALEGREQLGPVGEVDPGVDFADFALGLGGVLVLDDPRQVTGLVAHDAAVARGVLGLEGEHRQSGAGLAVGLEHREQGPGAQEGHVAAQDDDLAREARKRALGLEDGVGSAELLALLDGLDRLAQRGADLLGAVPDDGDRARDAQALHGREHVPDEGLARDPVEDLGQGALHPSSLACGENQCGELGNVVRRFGHRDSFSPITKAG